MNAIENTRISGMVERRPSASAMPTGIEATIPVTETTSVTSSPPHCRVSTIGKPPRSRPMTAITIATPEKTNAHMMRERQPLRTPPVRKNASRDAAIAAIAKSIQSELKNPCTPPPRRRKNATTGNATKNKPELSAFAGARGISSGRSNNAPSANVRLTRHRSAAG